MTFDVVIPDGTILPVSCHSLRQGVDYAINVLRLEEAAVISVASKLVYWIHICNQDLSLGNGCSK